MKSLILLLVVSAATALSPEECTEEGDVCLKYAGFDGKVPQTEPTKDGLDTYCRFMMNHVTCEGEFDSLCAATRETKGLLPARLYANEEAYGSWKSAVFDMCTPGNELYAVVYGNIKCIRGVTESTRETCGQRKKRVMEEYGGILRREGAAEQDALRKEDCMSNFVAWDCYTSGLTSECGELVGKTYLEFYRRGYETYDCKGDVDEMAGETALLEDSLEEELRTHLAQSIRTFRFD